MTTAELISPADFWGPFEAYSYSAFRLGTLQSYGGSGEDDDLVAFAAGRPRPRTRGRDRWTELLVSAHHAGRLQQRVHVVREPLNSYLEYELTWQYEPNVAAGEEIGIIPVTDSEWPPDLPVCDFWLFDSSALYMMIYEDDGTWAGAQPVTDPARIVQACRWRDAALYHATPWAEYIDSHPELKRHLAQ